MLKYCVLVIDTKDYKAFIETVKAGLSVPIGGELMSIASRLIQDGVQGGITTLLIRQLEQKFKTIPEKYRQRIEKSDPDSLVKWGERLLDSKALEDVFEA